MRKMTKVALSLLVATSSMTVNAELTFNGFASIKAGMLFDDPKDLNNNGIIESDENAYSGFITEDLSFKDNSLFAIQASADLTQGLSATIQLMAEGRDDFDVDARWAYLSYQLSDSWTVQAGRIILPAFYKSEFEKVGYAHNYNILPRSVYTPLAFSNVEGIRFNNNTYFGDWSLASSLGYSNWEGDIALGSNGESYAGSLKDIISGNFELNRDWLTLFGGAFVTDVEFDALDAAVTNPTIDALLGPAVQAGLLTSADIAQTKKALTFSGDGLYYYYGFDIDYNDWLATYEYAEYGIDDAGDSTNEVYYFTFGKRINDLVITATIGEYEQPIDQGHIRALHPIAQPVARAIKENLANQKYTLDQISIRYNFHPAAAFKFDLFSWDPLKSGEDLTGFSMGVDLVF